MEADEKGCGWLVQVDAAAYHNRDLAAIEAAMTDEELERYGPPEPWYPESPGEVYMEVPCGADVVAGGHLCEGHAEAMGLSDLEFEDALRRGVTWSNDHRPYD